MDHARWISWEDAWKQGQRVVGNLELVAAQLKQGLVGEKIPAIDQIITEGGKVETLDLSAPEFWEQVVYIDCGARSR